MFFVGQDLIRVLGDNIDFARCRAWFADLQLRWLILVAAARIPATTAAFSARLRSKPDPATNFMIRLRACTM